MITFFGYAVEKDGKYLGYVLKRDAHVKMYEKKFYKSPIFPVVCAFEDAQRQAYSHLGRIVKVRLTMEESEVSDGK